MATTLSASHYRRGVVCVLLALAFITGFPTISSIARAQSAPVAGGGSSLYLPWAAGARDTPTAKPSASRPTNTPAGGGTLTPTPSPTGLSSPTPTHTASPTQGGANTPTPTKTASPTQPALATPTKTLRPTKTPVGGASPTATLTATSMPLPGPTSTATSTPNVGPTPTATMSPSASPTLTPTATQPPSDVGPVAHWKFDETVGSVAADASGNGYTGTLVNGPVWSTGKLDGALSFDGVNDYVSTVDDPLDITGSLTISA